MKNILSFILLVTYFGTAYCSETPKFNDDAALSLLDRYIQQNQEFRSMLFTITHNTLTQKNYASFEEKNPDYHETINHNLPLETRLFLFILFKKLHSVQQDSPEIQNDEFKKFFENLRSRTLRLEAPTRKLSKDEHRLINDFNNFMISSANQAIVPAN